MEKRDSLAQRFGDKFVPRQIEKTLLEDFSVRGVRPISSVPYFFNKSIFHTQVDGGFSLPSPHYLVLSFGQSLFVGDIQYHFKTWAQGVPSGTQTFALQNFIYLNDSFGLYENYFFRDHFFTSTVAGSKIIKEARWESIMSNYLLLSVGFPGADIANLNYDLGITFSGRLLNFDKKDLFLDPAFLYSGIQGAVYTLPASNFSGQGNMVSLL